MDTTHVHEDFRDFLRLLNQHDVKYMIVGGYAVNYHGYHRTTDDLDLFVALSSENAERLIATLTDFGFGSVAPDVDALTERGRILRMGRKPMLIEILNDIDGVTFDECYATCERVELGGVTVPVIGLEKLLKNKRASGRLKDLADVENLE